MGTLNSIVLVSTNKKLATWRIIKTGDHTSRLNNKLTIRTIRKMLCSIHAIVIMFHNLLLTWLLNQIYLSFRVPSQADFDRSKLKFPFYMITVGRVLNYQRRVSVAGASETWGYLGPVQIFALLFSRSQKWSVQGNECRLFSNKFPLELLFPMGSWNYLR